MHLGKGQLVDLDGRLQTRQWDDDAGKRHWKAEVGGWASGADQAAFCRHRGAYAVMLAEPV